MKLNAENIQNMDMTNIYDMLSKDISSIYDCFKYLEMSEQEFYQLVLKEIENSKTTYSGNQSYVSFVKNNLIKELNNQTEHLLNNGKAFHIINNYINQEFNNPKLDVFYSIKQVGAFFEKYNYNPELDLIIKLLKKNNLFREKIGSIFHQYSSIITSGNIDNICDDNFFLMSVETYCMLNDIDIKIIDEKELYQDLDISNITGVYLAEISRYPLLSVTQEKELATRIANGDEKARKYFIECNLRLVTSIAKKYMNRGLSFLDMVQEGNLGLMIAVDHFDVSKGYKFSTYATCWIREAITRAIANKGRNIRISVSTYEKVQNYKAAQALLEHKLNREVTISEVAHEMGISIEEAGNLYKLQTDTVSLNSPVSDESDTEFGDLIPTNEILDDSVISNDLHTLIQNLLQQCKLTYREIDVLMLRYGLNDNEYMTLEEISHRYNITKERIRQIEIKALKKIRKSKYIKDFAIYMQNPDKALKFLQQFQKKSRKSKYALDYLETEDGPKTIYDQFPDYTKEDIYDMLTKLTNEERIFIETIYGTNLDIPVYIKLDRARSEIYYYTLVPKMEKILEEIVSVKNKHVLKKEKNDD